MKPGYVPALGTPLDAAGNLMKESYRRQIADQIQAGAVGVLCMGSMGIQAFLRSGICPEIARTAVEAGKGCGGNGYIHCPGSGENGSHGRN